MTDPSGMHATASVAATMGEWLQVHHPKHGRVQVSCPVGWRTTATVTVHTQPDKSSWLSSAKARPTHWGQAPDTVPLGPKALALVQAVCAAKSVPETCVHVQLNSPVPEGKGFASSTSDLVAIATAFGHAIASPFSAEELHRLAVGVEASDAIMIPGIVTAKLDEPQVLAVHPATPPVAFVTVIPEATLKTEHQPASHPTPDAIRLLDAMQIALTSQNLPAMARLATENAAMAQSRITTPHWQLVNDIAQEFDGLGVIIGHSGTLSAIICDTTHRTHQSRLTALTQTLTETTNCPVATAHPDLQGPQLL